MNQTLQRPKHTTLSASPAGLAPAVIGAGNTALTPPAKPVHHFAQLRVTDSDPLQRCECEEKVQREEAGQETGGEELATADVSGVVTEGLSSGGRPLDAGTRSFMEPRFGHDFSSVRIHDNAAASSSAQSVAARAYTVGNNIAFRSGEFAPGSSEGRRLLAHELTHVVQQGASAPLERSVQRALSVSELTGPGIQHRDVGVQRDDDDPQDGGVPAGVPQGELPEGGVPDNSASNGSVPPSDPNFIGPPVDPNAASPAAPNAPNNAPNNAAVPNTPNQAASPPANTDTSSLDSAFYGAVALGDWQKAAEVLNGFSADDIHSRIIPGGTLNQDQINRIYQGALDNPRVGPQSQVAQILAPLANATPNVAPPPGSGAGGTEPAGPSNALTPEAIAQMSAADKLLAAAKSGDWGDAAKNRFLALMTPENMVIMAAATVGFVLVEGTPIGWLATLATAAMIGKEASDVLDLIKSYIVTAIGAQTPEDLHQAGNDLAKAVTTGTSDVIIAILLHKAGNDIRPYVKPSSGLVDVVTTDGQVIRVPQDAIPENASATTGSGNTTDPNAPNQSVDPNAPNQPVDPNAPKQSVDPNATQAHYNELGSDPATGGFRANEAETALRVEQTQGVSLTRFKPAAGQKGDWVDASGKVYDGCSPPESKFFDSQLKVDQSGNMKGNYLQALQGHVNHPTVNTVVVDTTGLGLTPAQESVLGQALTQFGGGKILRLP